MQGQGIRVRDIHEQDDALDFSEGYQNISVLRIVCVCGVCEGRQNVNNEECKDVL